MFLCNEDDYKHFADGLNKLIEGYRFLFDEIVIITYDKVVKFSLWKKQYIYDESKELSSELSLKIQNNVSNLEKGGK